MSSRYKAILKYEIFDWLLNIFLMFSIALFAFSVFMFFYTDGSEDSQNLEMGKNETEVIIREVQGKCKSLKLFLKRRNITVGDFIDYSKKKLLNFNDENLINFDKEPKINCLPEIKPLKNVQIPDLVFKGLNGGVDIDVKSPEMIPEHFRAILGIKRVYVPPPMEIVCRGS